MDKILPAGAEDIKELKKLLEAEHLPTADIGNRPGYFFVLKDDITLVAGIGLEVYDRYGLLRSMVTSPAYRNRGLAQVLVNHLLQYARGMGLTEIYLLTETAQRWFASRGFREIKRDEAPTAIRQSDEFSHACPASAVLMKKKI